MSHDTAQERGPYLTANKALELERRIARLEGHLNARLDELEQRITNTDQAQADVLRAQIAALLDVLRGATPNHSHATPLRPKGAQQA